VFTNFQFKNDAQFGHTLCSLKNAQNQSSI